MPVSAAEEFTGNILGRKHRLHLADNAGVPLMERLKQCKKERVFLRGRHSQPILIVGVAENLRWGLTDVLSGKLKIRTPSNPWGAQTFLRSTASSIPGTAGQILPHKQLA